jgi:hypothetical protein
MAQLSPAVRMSHRPYLRALSPRNRRSWADQRARLTPLVPIGTACAPSATPHSPYAITVCRRKVRINSFISRLCFFS